MLRRLGRHIGLATLAGVVAGVAVGGLLGRLVMRVSGFMAPGMVGVRTENGNRVGDVTLEGTLAVIVVAGVASGVLGGVLYAGAEPWLRRFRPWHGLIFGVGLLGAVGFATLDPSNLDFVRFGAAPLNVAMFATLFVLFGVATSWVFDRLLAMTARAGMPGRVIEFLAWLALVPAALLVVVIIVNLTNNPDPLPTVLIAGALGTAAIARWRSLAPVVGYAAFAVPLAIGAARLAGGLPKFLSGF